MSTIPTMAAVRDNSTKYGFTVAVVGFVLLLLLRVWASPIARAVTGRSSNGLLEFLLIPVFLGIVGVGILLFLWEPETPGHDSG